MEERKCLPAYLRRRAWDFLLFAGMVAIFAAVFSLYDLPVEAVGYAALLCAVAALLYGIVDYICFARRHRALMDMRDRILFSVEGLPRSGGLLEADYQQLLLAVHQEKRRYAAAMDAERGSMMDYYTLWAHQIKTPIAAMRLLLQEAETEQDAALSLELFKIEQYVEMVLGYLRMDSSSTDYLICRCDLDDIVRQAVRKYARIFIRKKIALDFQESGRRVLTDEKWLVFVVEQLLSNALKYTRAGTITIYAADLFLVIRDTGIGIAPEDLPRVFDRGFTGYNGRTDKKSTGIGLYLCKRILTKLGHTISIDSVVGQGTTVRIGLDETALETE